MRGFKCGVEAECGHKLLMERLVQSLEKELEKMSLADLARG
jgi:DNA-binding IscR family transcriptional regulator